MSVQTKEGFYAPVDRVHGTTHAGGGRVHGRKHSSPWRLLHAAAPQPKHAKKPGLQYRVQRSGQADDDETSTSRSLARYVPLDCEGDTFEGPGAHYERGAERGHRVQMGAQFASGMHHAILTQRQVLLQFIGDLLQAFFLLQIENTRMMRRCLRRAQAACPQAVIIM
jgi:hypothetical protein